MEWDTHEKVTNYVAGETILLLLSSLSELGCIGVGDSKLARSAVNTMGVVSGLQEWQPVGADVHPQDHPQVVHHVLGQQEETHITEVRAG